ncbi:MAG: pyridoxamine 5'-phosphate oxidase family protein [Bacteroidales bacterium]|nr:pyridoxamine 5'-phosphate oxidase family protein [Bacteroidales bacterium]
MRRAQQEITDKSVLEEILGKAMICRLAMIDGDRPYILPFNYGYRDGCIFIHSAPGGKKIDLLARDNRVCFEVEDAVEISKGERACDWSTRYRSIVGYGTVEILSDQQGKQEGLEAIMAQHGAPDLIEFKQKNLDRMVILKVTITSKSGKQSSRAD